MPETIGTWFGDAEPATSPGGKHYLKSDTMGTYRVAIFCGDGSFLGA